MSNGFKVYDNVTGEEVTPETVAYNTGFITFGGLYNGGHFAITENNKLIVTDSCYNNSFMVNEENYRVEWED